MVPAVLKITSAQHIIQKERTSLFPVARDIGLHPVWIEVVHVSISE